MPPYRTVLFDLDGTLIDSIRLILDSYHHTLATHGLPARTDDHWLDGIGTPLKVQFKEWSDDPERLEAMVLTYRAYNMEHHDARVAAYPGIVDLLGAIHRRGLQIGIVTSKNREGAMRGLRVTGLDGWIEALIGADDVTHPKPHPEPVWRALERLGRTADSAVFVGDSRHDLESGRKAGVATAAVLWGPFSREHLADSNPDHWLERPDDLLPLLDA
jgi:pyrophosphatase PpaX